MLKIQEFLKTNSIADLESLYALKVKRHIKYPNLVLFKYDQLNSPMHEKICCEARGLILDESNNWSIVAFPYEKFWNHGEGHAAPIDWSTASVFEKADGSLMTLYWYDNQWNVASSGTPDAGGILYGTTSTFSELFWKVWKELGYPLPMSEWKDYNFMFELCTPYNKQVVQHKTNRIIWHGIRDRVTLKEQSPLDLVVDEWEVIKSYSLGSLDAIMKTLDSIPPTDGEGYVVCDAAFNRIKVKTPQYVALHHMRDGMGSKRMLEVVRSNESEEFLTYFPEFKSMHAQVKEKYVGLLVQIEEAWERVKNMPIGEDAEQKKVCQKEFALSVINVPFKGVLFGLRNGGIQSVKQGLREMNIKHLMEALKIKEIVLEF